MNRPTLVIMAAGMGSRYGGLKQLDPVTDEGEIIMDFSLYDAMMAGFDRAVFVIKEEMAEAFSELIEKIAGKYMETAFAYQKTDDLPEGYSVPEGRVKPWGTAHAVYSSRIAVDGPFAVINADDYYGPTGFNVIYDHLANCDNDGYDFCMVSYRLKNTITENGHVARGICSVTEDGKLEDIVERTKIMRIDDGSISFTEDDGESWTPLDEETQVSMNFWGFTSRMYEELGARFPEFLDDALADDPLKREYLLPAVTDALIKEGKATVKVLSSQDKWYGVTYKKDKPDVMAALRSMKDKGLYPEKLWK